MSEHDGILPPDEIRYLYAAACAGPSADVVAFVRTIERAVVAELLNGGGVHQVPVTTYMAPDGVTQWPAYSHEQRQEYAAAAVLIAKDRA
jgi:hypothetical protein